MKLFNTSKKAISLTIVLLITLPALSIGALQDQQSLLIQGSIVQPPPADVTVTINSQQTIGSNRLSLGFMVDFEWQYWRDRAPLRQLAENANFKLIRVFDFRRNPSLAPCTHWDESTKTGTWDWSEVDLLVQRIYEVGAEPLFTLGASLNPISNYIPSGMTINPTTGLPYPDSWAAYCKEWPKHFKNIGVPVRFYELFNEPWMYFGWDDYTKIGYFMTVFNAAAQAMKAQDSNVLVSFDSTNRKPVLDYWLSHGGADLGFIAFHKYDAGEIGQYDDATMLDRAEYFQLETTQSYYGVQDARTLYYNSRGSNILVINSESNFNSECEIGTDPKIQQVVGSVWLALVLRTGIQVGLDYNVYYSFTCSAKYQQANWDYGVGFGMVNLDDNQPWYPYYTQQMIGNNLDVGDSIIQASSSKSEVRVLSWINNGETKILIINKINQPRTVRFMGVSGQLDVAQIDESIPWENPSVQYDEISASSTLTLPGYAVALLTVTN